MALLGSRALNLSTSNSRPQARLRCQPQQLLLKPGTSRSRRGICRQAAASDQKNASEPMYLSDLIMFESDAESASPTSSSSSDLDAAAGTVEGQGGDPTVRAQEIISRATEVLAAARAALGTSNAAAASEGASDPSGSSSISSRGRSAGGAATLEQPLPPTSSGGAGGWQAAAKPQGYSACGSRQQQPTGSPAASSSSDGYSSSGSSPISSSSSDGGSSGSEPLTRRWSPLSEDQDLTRHVLQNALDQMQRSGAPIAAPKEEDEAPPATASSAGTTQAPGSSSSSSGRGGAAGGPAGGPPGGSRSSSRDIRKGRGAAGPGSALLDDGHGPAPSWAQSLLGSDDFGGAGYSFPSGGGSGGPSPAASVMEPQMQRTLQQAADRPSAWGWATEEAEPLRLPPAALGLLSQSELDAQRARTAVLPPLQSVVELTTAFRPPERSGGVAVAPAPAPAPEATTATATAEAAALAAPVGRALPDGSGRLADGTWWEKKSGIERGKNGYWKRWQLLKGGNAEGTLEWEETWWEASDWTGLKEMGARKEGRNTDGAAWRETWSERLMYASNALDTVVERNAHKWAADPTGDEWEEKWDEHYHSSGKVAKYADKWGKAGPNVWHERWGEDYDAGGDACVKWTDKWAERLLPGGAREQWGDKWHEAFANGRGEKNGEVWSVGAGGDRYQRWWGEQHLGGQRVRRHGHSTTGENWDDTITMDTYYNPVPHFGFKHALSHSPQLRGVPLQPKEINDKDPFGPGMDDL